MGVFPWNKVCKSSWLKSHFCLLNRKPLHTTIQFFGAQQFQNVLGIFLREFELTRDLLKPYKFHTAQKVDWVKSAGLVFENKKGHGLFCKWVSSREQLKNVDFNFSDLKKPSHQSKSVNLTWFISCSWTLLSFFRLPLKSQE